ncbi:hypothetical protein J7444_19870 [Labrenzia sp. R4_1]|uniref:hypothetical protein n=1 Tax=Stappiaceae TaxID=2821832 RepID=UPI001ADC22C6|nr:hypothetical protein [Labrenzia sp. R4_1]MBO9427003.1 hypothetical protein [Labrenzia sp. R4_1]
MNLGSERSFAAIGSNVRTGPKVPIDDGRAHGPCTISRHTANWTAVFDAPAPIDTAPLKSALKVTALPDQKLGDDYLPFFMRLETELAQHEAKEAARARVQKVLKDG